MSRRGTNSTVDRPSERRFRSGPGVPVHHLDRRMQASVCSAQRLERAQRVAMPASSSPRKPAAQRIATDRAQVAEHRLCIFTRREPLAVHHRLGETRRRPGRRRRAGRGTSSCARPARNSAAVSTRRRKSKQRCGPRTRYHSASALGASNQCSARFDQIRSTLASASGSAFASAAATWATGFAASPRRRNRGPAGRVARRARHAEPNQGRSVPPPDSASSARAGRDRPRSRRRFAGDPRRRAARACATRSRQQESARPAARRGASTAVTQPTGLDRAPSMARSIGLRSGQWAR